MIRGVLRCRFHSSITIADWGHIIDERAVLKHDYSRVLNK